MISPQTVHLMTTKLIDFSSKPHFESHSSKRKKKKNTNTKLREKTTINIKRKRTHDSLKHPTWNRILNE